ncbi:MAG: SRPBCC family protein [Gemmatimonadota bacterium]
METFLPLPVEQVHGFFSDAGNLEHITPPELRFDIVTRLPVEMSAGTLLDYRLRLFGVGFRWRTRITVWDPPHRFVDEQLRGPYQQWVHLHTFEPTAGGTRMVDRVRYQLPLHPLSMPATRLVRHQLHRIFSYRDEAIRDRLGDGSDSSAVAGGGPGSSLP